MQPHLTTSWSSSHCRHLGLSMDHFMSLHMLSQCCQRWCGCSHVDLVLDNRRNLQLGIAILHISVTVVVGCVPLSWLHQFVRPHLLLPNTLYVMLYCFGDFAHHPARFIFITQLAELCIFFFIFLLIPIMISIGTCKIAQSVSDSIQNHVQHYFRLSGCRPRAFSSSHTFQLLRDRCLCISNSLSCHSGFSFHIILDPFLVLSIAKKVRFLSLLCRTLLFRSYAAQLSQRLDHFCVLASLVIIGLMTWTCRLLCRFAEFAHPKWRKFLFGALPIVLCIDLDVGRDVGCCKIWTTWRQAESFMSRIVCLINSNKGKYAF